jgi:hypothetical protein
MTTSDPHTRHDIAVAKFLVKHAIAGGRVGDDLGDEFAVRGSAFH